MDLKKLGQHIESVAGRAATNESEPDDDTGLAVVFDQSQQHYTHREPCGAVVAALDLKGLTVREARAALADANAVVGTCGGDDQALTPPEVAKRLGVKPATVVSWIKSGQLKASNLSKGVRPRYRVQPDDLADFLDKRQPQQRAARPRKPKSDKPKRY